MPVNRKPAPTRKDLLAICKETLPGLKWRMPRSGLWVVGQFWAGAGVTACMPGYDRDPWDGYICLWTRSADPDASENSIIAYREIPRRVQLEPFRTVFAAGLRQTMFDALNRMNDLQNMIKICLGEGPIGPGTENPSHEIGGTASRRRVRS